MLRLAATHAPTLTKQRAPLALLSVLLVHSSIDLGTQSTTLRNAVTLALILHYLKLLLSCTQAKDSFGLMLKKFKCLTLIVYPSIGFKTAVLTLGLNNSNFY